MARLAGYALLMNAMVAGSAAAQSAAPAPGPPAQAVGAWQGPLPIPGGSVPIQLNLTAPAPGKLAAVLDLPAKRMNRVPMTVALRGDSLVLTAAGPSLRYACLLTRNGQELRGTWTQPGLRVPLVLQREAAGTQAQATQTQAEPTTYHTEKVALTSPLDKVQLAGTLSIPDGAGPFPAAVLLSDAGPQDRDGRQGEYRPYADLATALARQGIAVLRLDDRGVRESGGTWSAITTTDYVRDAQAALAYLRVRPSLDAARTGLIGHGEGGNVALLAAAQPTPPAFVVALAAAGVPGLELVANQPEPVVAADTAAAGAARRQALANVLAEAAKLRASGSNAAQVDTYLSQQRLKLKNEERKQAEATVKFRRAMFDIIRQTPNDDQAQAIAVNMMRQRQPSLDPAVARARAVQYTTPWHRAYLKFDPQPLLPAVKCPVLLVQGTDDALVNATTNLAALEKGLKANKRLTVRRLPGVNHWLQTPASELIKAADGTVDAIVSAPLLETVRDWVLQEAGK